MESTEFQGDETTPAGVQPKPREALSASEKLGLIYRTGTLDSTAEADGQRAWTGQSADS